MGENLRRQYLLLLGGISFFFHEGAQSSLGGFFRFEKAEGKCL